ncbi:hypothetical protein EYF80_031616 [Liparis tanakae]|uniref:Uncharacterized protein n=1 Tax=Liparis tanakae TaxID=230148 RepID=A0A4Z2GZH8_9TELE|nr:hypothetical protein EYF80_031616 [Liparis tanakae]
MHNPIPSALGITRGVSLSVLRLRASRVKKRLRERGSSSGGQWTVKESKKDRKMYKTKVTTHCRAL